MKRKVTNDDNAFLVALICFSMENDNSLEIERSLITVSFLKSEVCGSELRNSTDMIIFFDIKIRCKEVKEVRLDDVEQYFFNLDIFLMFLLN
jgi:hypothetical protein